MSRSIVMTAQPSVIKYASMRSKLRGERAKTSASSLVAYQLDVIAPSVADVVRAAGGWLFDRTVAGWTVNVTVPVADQCDVRTLRVLGIATLCNESAFESLEEMPRNRALAVAADSVIGDARVRRHLERALDSGLTEVTLWGDTGPAEIRHHLHHVQHRLSGAAQAFKARALVPTAVPRDPRDSRDSNVAATVAGTESFQSRARWFPRVDSDLTPVG